VPRHTVVDDPPEGVSLDELPRMLNTDTIARYYDWSVGTIVQIKRLFGGHEPIHYFRLVVDATGVVAVGGGAPVDDE
jgi:DNA-directed RNA polymerase subunit H (RpoH/RPB5)